MSVSTIDQHSMVTFLKSVARLLRTIASGKMLSEKQETDMLLESPNTFVFPLSLIDKGKSEGVNKSYTPHELSLSILNDSHAVDSIGHIIVQTMSYYKNKVGAQHEFLVFEVQHTQQGLVNYIKLDRCPESEPDEPPGSLGDLADDTWAVQEDCSVQGGPPTYVVIELFRVVFSLSVTSQEYKGRPPGSSTFSSSSSNLLGARDARDLFLISSSGELDSITTKEDKMLAKIVIAPSKIPLECLLVLASVVSKHQPRYHLFKAQCYWYAFTVWEVLRVLHPELPKVEWGAKKAGKIGHLPWIEWHKSVGPGKDDVAGVKTSLEAAQQELANKFRVAWELFEQQAVDCKEVSYTVYSLRL